MAKEAVFQVRMDSDIKESVEALYKGFGTTFAEAVRILAYQSLIQNDIPIKIEPPKSINVKLMTAEEIEDRINGSLSQIRNGEGISLAEVKAKHERRKKGV